MCDSAAVNAAVDHGAVWMRALELRDALLAGDAAAIEAMSDPEFWERAGRDELLGLIAPRHLGRPRWECSAGAVCCC